MRGSAVASDTHRINRPHENVGLSNRIKREGSHWRWQIFWNSTVILQGSPLPAQRLGLRLVDSSYSLGARLGWLTNKSTPLICGEYAVNETHETVQHFKTVTLLSSFENELRK